MAPPDCSNSERLLKGKFWFAAVVSKPCLLLAAAFVRWFSWVFRVCSKTKGKCASLRVGQSSGKDLDPVHCVPALYGASDASFNEDLLQKGQGSVKGPWMRSCLSAYDL